jgi:hypothetical protein
MSDKIYGCPFCGEELGDSIPDKCPACKMPIHREDVEVYKDESFKETSMTKAKQVLNMLEGTFDIGNDSSTHNIIVKIKGVDKEFYKAPFGRQLEDLKKVKAFIETAKSYYVGAKGRGTLAAVKQWIKETSPSEYYAKWKKDSSNYKDDSVQVFYR